MDEKDKAWFSNNENGRVTYQYVRGLNPDKDNDLLELIQLLKTRLEAILINQSQILHIKDNKLNKGASFPLAVMTSVGIQTLGQILFKENPNKQSHQFVEALKLLDKKFGHQLKKNDKSDLKNIWGEDFTSSNIGEIIYTYFRNSMIHGYRGKGVFLSFQLETLYNINSGYVIINPNKLWENFILAFNKEFDDLLLKPINHSNPKVVACKKYLDEVLNK